VPQALARKVMAHLAPLLRKMLPPDKFELVAHHTVRRIHAQNMAQALEEPDVVLRNALFDHFKNEGDFSGACVGACVCA